MNQRVVVEVGASVPLVLLAASACRFRMRLRQVGVWLAFGSTWDRQRRRHEVCRGVVLPLIAADCSHDEERYFEFSTVVVEEVGLHDFAEEEHEVASPHAGGFFPRFCLQHLTYQRPGGGVWQSRPFSLCAVEVLSGQHTHGVSRFHKSWNREHRPQAGLTGSLRGSAPRLRSSCATSRELRRVAVGFFVCGGVVVASRNYSGSC